MVSHIVMLSLTLPSNASPNKHPSNTVATFRTYLSDAINLSGTHAFEIGLREILFPTLISNVMDCWLTISQPGQTLLKEKMEEGLYTDDKQFFDKLKGCMNKLLDICTVQIGDHNRLVTIWIHNKASLDMSRNLANMLGFDKTTLTNDTADRLSFTGQQAFDINRGLDHIFVYCNLCTDVPLGHTKSPLLRCIKSNISSAPKPQSITFSDISYTPMSVKNFDSILVYLRLSDGRPVPFLSGTCVVTLVIRRKTPHHIFLA